MLALIFASKYLHKIIAGCDVCQALPQTIKLTIPIG